MHVYILAKPCEKGLFWAYMNSKCPNHATCLMWSFNGLHWVNFSADDILNYFF